MNREINFRVFNGIEMITDVVVGKFGAFYVNPELKRDGLDPKDTASLTPNNTKYHGNIPVMQFTGLIDKNGKEIYEGDIVRVFGQAEIPFDDRKDFEIITYEHTGTIIFESGCFSFKNHLTREQLKEHVKYFPESESDIICTIDEFLSVEIIGNIYENSELLK